MFGQSKAFMDHPRTAEIIYGVTMSRKIFHFSEYAHSETGLIVNSSSFSYWAQNCFFFFFDWYTHLEEMTCPAWGTWLERILHWSNFALNIALSILFKWLLNLWCNPCVHLLAVTIWYDQCSHHVDKYIYMMNLRDTWVPYRCHWGIMF